ncbi:MAG: CoA transferase [Anaerolineae bacterium]|nr:CoA transferase [Anaerolineae bacterium]
MSVTRPLDGLVVLDFTRIYSGPYATLLLADLGARVIKVEHPGGGDDSRAFGPRIDETSGYFETLNRGKASIAIDYRQPEGRQLLQRLATRVDVLAENFKAGQMARYGLDYDTLKSTCPRLVYVSISGFGQAGPDVARGCYDIVAQAMSGLMSVTGFPDQPLKTGPAIADAISGLTAATGLLAALWQRERTGRGAYIEVAMVDALFACLENVLVTYDVTGHIPVRQGNVDAVLAPFDSFQTADGWVVIGIGNDRLWQALARLVDPALEADSRFTSNAGRVEHYAVLRPILSRWCRTFPTSTLLAQLHAVNIPSGPIRTIDELAHDSHLEARGMLVRVQLQSGRQITVPGSPIHIAEVPLPPIRRGPRLGEHTRAILEEFLDVGAEELAYLSEKQLIKES